ncbi:MAG: trypsin-like peptidase domain-containing protein, partial [Clostridia bacterium]|nr:trypsin-like peptidase domain-containing protein [Clostridia bacterium]
KRSLSLILAFLAVFLLMAGCGEDRGESVNSSEDSSSLEEVSTETSSKEESKAIEISSKEAQEAVSQLYETPEEYIRYGLADAVEKVSQSVVSIKVLNNQYDIWGGEHTLEGNGSGVIVSDSGYIATNYHVIEGAEKISVFLSDNSEYTATIVGKDSKTDLAVIKIECDKGLKPVVFADSSTLRLGDFVFAIGNALGKYSGSVTMGIISSLSRSVKVNSETMEMLQTDAALNSGNSGGGLFDSHGYLVGIVSAKEANSESEGVGFAIPANVAKTVVDDIIVHGYVTGRPTLGFETVDITSMREAQYYGVEWIGVYISSVKENSFGETAGLKSRDYIYSVNGEVISSTNRLEEILEESSIGDTLLLEIWRGKSSIDVILIIGEEVS